MMTTNSGFRSERGQAGRTTTIETKEGKTIDSRAIDNAACFLVLLYELIKVGVGIGCNARTITLRIHTPSSNRSTSC